MRDIDIRQHSKRKIWAGNFGGRRSLALDLNSCQLDDVYLVICISRILTGWWLSSYLKNIFKYLNAEFQRIARRDKKAFLSEQCKETEEHNRMGKSRDLFKKIRDTKGTFHAKMSAVKGRNGMDLTEAEEIKKRWQEYTEELYRKDLHDPDNHDDVITHLEPDILESEVKRALGSITSNKASEGDGIPAELFWILKDAAVKLLHSICQQIWKTQQWPQDWKRSVSIPIPKNVLLHNCPHFTC